MKNFLVALMVTALFGTSFVSCIDNEVSPEIKKIYQGHADLLASQVTVNQAEAALKAAEATLKTAEAALKIAEAEGVAAQTALILVEVEKAKVAIEKAKLDLQIIQSNHATSLKVAGFAAVDALFGKYVTYRNLATARVAARNLTATSLKESLIALGKGKIDSVVNVGFALELLKKTAEEKLKLAQYLLALTGSNAKEKIRLELVVAGKKKVIDSIKIVIALKRTELATLTEASSINAIELEISTLEDKKTTLETENAQYNEIIIAIDSGRPALVRALRTAADDFERNANLLALQKKVVVEGWFNRAALVELTNSLKLQLVVMNAEIVELVLLASKYKALAEAALVAATNA